MRPKKHARQAFDFFAAHNTPFSVFVGTVLCAARRPAPPPADGAAAMVARGACVLQRLNAHGPYHAFNLKRHVAEFAGVLMRATPRAAHFKAIASAP